MVDVDDVALWRQLRHGGAVGHVAKGVDQSHGEGEGEAGRPYDDDDDLGEKLARLSPERVNDGAVPGRTKERENIVLNSGTAPSKASMSKVCLQMEGFGFDFV